jgi:hypothetical protein
MDNNPFDNLEISLEQAIDRLEKSQPVYVTFKGGESDTVTAIFGNEVLTLKSVRLLADVVFFSSDDDRFDEGNLEITVL